MKVLYAIQGTGNGHVARAQEVVPVLMQYVDVDLLLSGSQCELTLPWPVKYRLHGFGFVFGKKGGVDLRKTFSSNSIKRFFKEVRDLPVHEYDLVISDFEPVSSWACKLKGKKCIGISHQSAILHTDAPQPAKSNWVGKAVLRYYAPVSKAFGFHFRKLGDLISTPVIRKDVRGAQPARKGHYTVYLPAYDDIRIIAFLARFPEVKWEVFSKHSKHPYSFQNIMVQPVNQVAFTHSMVTSNGVFCNAGFETPAEALFLKKKLCVIPMTGQYEQQCNAAMLQSMGVPVMPRLKEEFLPVFEIWLSSEAVVEVSYPDVTQRIIEKVLEETGNFQIEYFPMAGAILMPAR